MLREGRRRAAGTRPEGVGVFGEHKLEGSQEQRIHTQSLCLVSELADKLLTP